MEALGWLSFPPEIAPFDDRVVKKSIAVDLPLLECYDASIHDLEHYLVRQAKQHDAHAFHRLRTIPGVY